MTGKTIIRDKGIYTAGKYSWMWPDYDTEAWQYMCNHPHLPSEIMKYVGKTRRCILAGAHTGFYAKQYAQIFDLVYAIEPEPTNFLCLVNNVDDDNVIKLQAALSNHEETKFIQCHVHDNSGAFALTGVGTTPCITIQGDSLPGPVDLIHLDVEGYEEYALRGLTSHILNYSPTIALETVDPYPWRDAEVYLLELGYKIAERLVHDTIYIK